MMHLFSKYPYLLLSSLLLIICLLGLWLSKPGYRKLLLFSGLISIPTSFSSILFVPDYWDPARIIDITIGPEDLIFSFSTGIIIWFFITKMTPGHIDYHINTRQILGRFLKVILAGCLTCFSLLLLQIGIMLPILIAIIVVGVWIAQKNSKWLRVSAAGFFSFTLFYTLLLRVNFHFNPFFIEQWSHDGLSGLFIWGIPLEEISWAAATGAVWPLIISYLFEVRISSSISNMRDRQ